MQEIKKSYKLKWWPSPQDYNEAVQNPRTNLTDSELKNAVVATDNLGLPRPMTGAFASVYRLSTPQGDVALRCFLRSISDQEQRYALISDFVRKDTLPYTVTFDFVQAGVRVNGAWFPVLKMEWVDGATLDSFVRENLENEHALQQLVDRFVTMCTDLRGAGIAHGDLQHGNILVKEGELKLVDYDGMFVPGMGAFLSNEIGHPNYQHPGRESRHFGTYLDNFSAWVIFASLQSIALDPELFTTLAAGDDCLLFRRDDFLQPLHSHAFWVLENHSNQEIVRMARFLRWNLKCDPKDVPPLANGTFEVLNLPAVHKPERKVQSTGAVLVPGGPPLSTVESSNLPEWINGALNATGGRVSRPVSNRASGQKSAPMQHLHPLIEQELRIPIPRPVSRNLTCERHDPVTFQWAMLLNPLVWMMFYIACIAVPNDRLLINNGIDCEGSVVDTRKTSGKNVHLEVTYKFVLDDSPRSVGYGVASAPESDSRRFIMGMPITVRALKDNPSVAEPVFFGGVSTRDAAQKRLVNDEVSLLLLVLANIILELCIWLGPLKQRGLVKLGHPALATVSQLTRAPGNKGVVRYIVEYTFNSPRGRVLGYEKVTENQFHTLTVGDKVSVLYDPQNPNRNVLYRFSFYQALP